jgi:hypothetical protein
VERGGIEPSVVGGDVHEDIVDSGLGVLHGDIEVTASVEDPVSSSSNSGSLLPRLAFSSSRRPYGKAA